MISVKEMTAGACPLYSRGIGTASIARAKEMVAQIRKKLDVLEDLTEPVSGLDAKCGGWKPVIEYISSLREAACENI